MVAEDDGPPTPNTSSSFAFFKEAAKLLAERVEAVETLKLRHLSAIDMLGAKRCAAMSAELRDMESRFATWPTCDPETVALERPVLVPRLTEIMRDVEEMVETLPQEVRARVPR